MEFFLVPMVCTSRMVKNFSEEKLITAVSYNTRQKHILSLFKCNRLEDTIKQCIFVKETSTFEYCSCKGIKLKKINMCCGLQYT